jgi:predicted nucleotidyltransferase
MIKGQERRRRLIEEDMARIVEALEPLKPEKVLVFGSCARGDFHEGSDIDLLVVMPTDERFLERIGRVQEAICTKLPVQVVVYTPEEFETLLRQSNAFVSQAVTEGQVIYERPES